MRGVNSEKLDKSCPVFDEVSNVSSETLQKYYDSHSVSSSSRNITAPCDVKILSRPYMELYEKSKKELLLAKQEYLKIMNELSLKEDDKNKNIKITNEMMDKEIKNYMIRFIKQI